MAEILPGAGAACAMRWWEQWNNNFEAALEAKYGLKDMKNLWTWNFSEFPVLLWILIPGIPPDLSVKMEKRFCVVLAWRE